MLGRRDLRLLHPLPQRGPLGAAAHLPQADAQLPAPDAAARAEPARLPPLRGHASSTASWTSRPRTAWTSSASSTRSTTSATCASAIDAVRRTGKHAQGTICYTDIPAAHRREVRRDGPATQGPRLRLASASRTWPRCSSRNRPTTSSRAIKETCGEDTLVHVHVHATTGVTMVSLMKAIEAGADIVDTSISSLSLGPGPQPHRGPGRDAAKAPATRPGWTRTGCSRSRTTSPRSARATPSSSPRSSASRPRSSTARSPAA